MKTKERKRTAIEETVADTLLQSSKTVTIAGKDYQIAPPTIATLAMVSREIARLPVVPTEIDEALVFRSLNMAKDFEDSVNVIGILILGAKAIRDEEKGQKSGIFGKARKTSLKILCDELLYNATPQELLNAFTVLLGTMQIGDFFGFTASLSKVNILAPTTAAVTTASGR